MDSQTDRPVMPPLKPRGQKIILYIALALALASFVCFGISMKQETYKDKYQLVGGICLVVGAILLFIAALQTCFSGSPKTFLRVKRPIRPKPLIATLIAIYYFHPLTACL